MCAHVCVCVYICVCYRRRCSDRDVRMLHAKHGTTAPPERSRSSSTCNNNNSFLISLPTSSQATTASLAAAGSGCKPPSDDMDVTVTCQYDIEHPLYTVSLCCAGNTHEAVLRYQSFKSFETSLLQEIPSVDFKCVFPRVFKRNMFGIKLTRAEVETRRSALQLVTDTVTVCVIHTVTVTVCDSLFTFLYT